MVVKTDKKSPILRVLDAFPDAKPSGSQGWFSAKCTGHDDTHASLSFRETESGGVIFKCHAQGCSRESILQGAGLRGFDLSPGGDFRPAFKPRPKFELIDLAADKLIPWQLLLNCGVSDEYSYHGRSVVRITYYTIDGKPYSKVRIRLGLSGNDSKWDEDTPGQIIPYGYHKLDLARRDKYLCIGEGESDAWTFWLHDMPFLAVPGGTNDKCLNGAALYNIPRIYVIQEPDNTGKAFYSRVHRRLRFSGYSGELYALPFKESTGCKDPNELHKWLVREHRFSAFKEVIAQALTEAIPSGDITLPEIFIGDQLRTVADHALKALERQEDENPSIFVQSASLVRVGTDELQRPVIKTMGIPEIKHALTFAADWYRLKETSGGPVKVPVAPPANIAENILSRPVQEWPFQPLEAIVQIPTPRSDGTLLSEHGYDPQTGLYYARQPDLYLPEISAHPTKLDIAQAVAFLVGFLGDFPYETKADAANAFGLLITIVIRHLVRHVPLALIDATKQGVGKGLLTDLMAIIATGRTAASVTQCSSDEEWDKKLTALLISGATMIPIDNVEGTLRSPILSKILTSDYHNGRILGLSKMVLVPQRAIWIANGNNIHLGGDLPRRSYRIRLATQVSEPWKRADFTYPDLLKEAQRHRGEIIAALLTLVSRWFTAGQPAPKKPLSKLGTFSRWVEVTGGILAFAGIDGFLENLDAMHKEIDLDGNAWTSFLETWHEKLGQDAYTTKQLLEKLHEDSEFAETLPDQLATILPDYNSKPLSVSRKFGRILAKKKGTPYGKDNLHIQQGNESHEKVAMFKVVEFQKSGTSPFAGFAGFAGLNAALNADEKRMD
jgi:hypothetical protein